LKRQFYYPRYPVRPGFHGLFNVEIEEPISWVLGVAAISFAWGSFSVFNPLFYVSPDFIAILLGFTLHELAHKAIALRGGFKAGFVAFGPGLAITFLSGLLPGIAILAPGYVRVVGVGLYRESYMLYSIAAGPITNIVLAVVGVALHLSGAPVISSYGLALARINSYIAFFNLIPIPPLDGSKIIRGSPVMWILLMILSLILLLYS